MTTRVRVGDTSREAVQARCIWLRHAYGVKQKVFAEKLGISVQRWNNIEVGTCLLSQQMAMKLVDLTGASLDWLYRGYDYRGGITLHLAAMLDATAPPGETRKMAAPLKRDAKGFWVNA